MTEIKQGDEWKKPIYPRIEQFSQYTIRLGRENMKIESSFNDTRHVYVKQQEDLFGNVE